VVKRCFDLLSAFAALILLSPFLLLIAYAIKCDDGGRALFTQVRVGKRKRPFHIFKFRTMREGHVTRVGRWLRSTGLDELPQLVNVLRGDMSVIGPRPLTFADVERLGWHASAYALRWSVRPGIIGLAQLYAGRGARLSWFLDRSYVTGQTRLTVDAAIIVLSAAIALAGKRRVRRWLRAHHNVRKPPLNVARRVRSKRGLSLDRAKQWHKGWVYSPKRMPWASGKSCE
jgi:lipopolysaccharide/colanic/teichoic acid biosynthesis glycosyltransferase